MRDHSEDNDDDGAQSQFPYSVEFLILLNFQRCKILSQTLRPYIPSGRLVYTLAVSSKVYPAVCSPNGVAFVGM